MRGTAVPAEVHELARIYRSLGPGEQRVFRALVADEPATGSTSSPVALLSRTTGREFAQQLTRLWSELLAAHLAPGDAVEDWNLVASAIPAFVPVDWVEELEALPPHDSATSTLDWES